MDRPRVLIFSSNFFYPIPFALCLLIFRTLLEKFCFEPLGIYLGIRPPKIIHNNSSSKLISTLKNTSLLSTTQVSNIKYIGISNNFNKTRSEENQKIYRFSRSCWYLFYYLIEFIHGMVILWNKPWLWNIRECWTDYPRQKITTDIWIYYVMNLAYFWSLLIKIFVHERRKDFTESVIHHTVAICLLSISLVFNAFRIGTLVIVVLFVSDIFLELAKLFKYLNRESECAACFGIYSLVWTLTRLIIYPFWILRHTLIDVQKIIVMTPSIYLLNTLLCLVAVLNIYWTYQIYKLLWKAITGQEINDDRSDTEESENEKVEDKKVKCS